MIAKLGGSFDVEKKGPFLLKLPSAEVAFKLILIMVQRTNLDK